MFNSLANTIEPRYAVVAYERRNLLGKENYLQRMSNGEYEYRIAKPN